MGKVIDDSNVGRLVSDIKAKADASYWPKDQTQEVELADVATTGDYADLLNKPSGGVGSFVYVGSSATSASTVTKVVTTETFPTVNGEPVVGTVIAVKFGATNTATAPKLNVNGLGAQSIYYNTAVATSTSATYGGTANKYTYYMWDGENWCWLSQGNDSDTNTIGYTIRTSAQRLPVSSSCYRYRLLFTSADGTKRVPANNSTSTNATSSRTPCQEKIDPFGDILYYATTTALSANGSPSATYLYEQYAGVTIGYSFNNTGAAQTMTYHAPIYVKCAPQTDGSAIIDSTTPYVQALPSTNDGKIYIFLGIATSATAFELMLNHPVYYHDGTALRMWTGPVSASSGVTDVTVGGTSVVTNGVAAVPAIPDAVEANPTVPSGTTPTDLTGLKVGSSYYGISGSSTEIFEVTYNSTTGAQIKAAYDAGKILRLVYNDNIYSLAWYSVNGSSADAVFGCVDYYSNTLLSTCSITNDVWSNVNDEVVNADWNASSGRAQILNKPTIPTVPTISTNIATDATSDTMTASPKAVKDYVDANAGGAQFFDVIYDVTTKADIRAAYNAGKILRVIYSNSIGQLGFYYDNTGSDYIICSFFATDKDDMQEWYYHSNIGWSRSMNRVLFATEQSLTDEQKAQARTNIGAGTSSFSGSYNDLSNKPTIPTVPTISTDISADATSNTKTASPKAVKDYVDVPIVTSYPSGGFRPNKIYDLGSQTGSKTYALYTTGLDTTVKNEWVWSFTTGSTAPTITWPSPTGMKWDGGSAPTINSNCLYEISIRRIGSYYVGYYKEIEL